MRTRTIDKGRKNIDVISAVVLRGRSEIKKRLVNHLKQAPPTCTMQLPVTVTRGTCGDNVPVTAVNTSLVTVSVITETVGLSW